MQHLQQNPAGGRGTIKCLKPTQQRPPSGQPPPYVTTSARLPALASVLERSPGKQSPGLFAIPAHPPRPRAFAASPAEPRRGTWHHKAPRTNTAAPTRRSGTALCHHMPASRPAHGAGARQTAPRTVCYSGSPVGCAFIAHRTRRPNGSSINAHAPPGTNPPLPALPSCHNQRRPL